MNFYNFVSIRVNPLSEFTVNFTEKNICKFKS